jgi:hypothetical protein
MCVQLTVATTTHDPERKDILPRFLRDIREVVYESAIYCIYGGDTIQMTSI